MICSDHNTINMFWYGWPSWVVEPISGLVTNFGARSITFLMAQEWNDPRLNTWATRLLVGFLLSYVYERILDVNKWSNTDFEQRATGIVGAEILFDLTKVLT